MVEERRIRLWQDKVETQIDMNGDGPPLVFLHGPWGLRSDRDFLNRLAATHRIYAPRHPGTTPGDPDAIHQLDEWWDLVVYYGELLDRLGLGAPALVGHSFGGHGRLRDRRRDAGAGEEARPDRSPWSVAGRAAGQQLDDPAR